MIEIPRFGRYSLVVSLFTLLITSIFMTQIQLVYAQVNFDTNYSTTNSIIMQNNILLITNILAKNLENYIQKAGAILEITSKLPQVRDVPFAHLLNQTLATLHGIPQDSDIEKRLVAKNIIDSNSNLYEISFIMPNGDMYLEEPYSEQQLYIESNLAFRDYFQGTIRTNDTYLGNVITDFGSANASGVREAVIANPVYSLNDNSTITGLWNGGIDLGILNKELQSLNITSLDGNIRVVYVDNNGQKAADSDITKSTTPESFANLKSFKNAISGQAGTTVDTVNNAKMLVTYQPVKIFSNTWAVLLMQQPTLQQ